jgi:hypothetical protein
MCVFVVLLASLLFVSLDLYLSPPRLKRMIRDGAGGILNRQVSIDACSFGIFKGLEADKISVSKYPSFMEGVFFTTDHVLLKADISGIINHQHRASKLYLGSPTLYLTGSSGNGPKDVRTESMQFPAIVRFLPFISDLRVESGTILYGDTEKSTLKIRDISMALKNSSIELPSELNMKFDVAREKREYRFDVNGKADIIKGLVTLNGSSVTTGSRTLTFNGSLVNIFDPDNASYVLTFHGDKDAFNLFAKNLELDFAFGKGKKASMDFVVSGKFKETNLFQ